MSLTVTVRDNETGDTATATVVDGDFLLITAQPCQLDSTQRYGDKGTTVLTVKDHWPRKLEARPMSDTPTAALAAALVEAMTSTTLFETDRPDMWRAAADDLDRRLRFAGYALVPSGSLLDMARVLIALADHIDGIGYGDATEDHPMASVVIAAARERVQAAEPGT